MKILISLSGKQHGVSIKLPKALKKQKGLTADVWYDSHIRLYTVQWKTDEGFEMGESQYALDKAEALTIVRHGPQENHLRALKLHTE